MHLVTVVVCVMIMVALGICGRRCRGSPSERPLRWWWLAIVVVVQLANVVFYAIFIRNPADATNPEPHVDWSVALPLQICDLAGLLAIPALATRSRLLRTIMYYWAIGLTTQAFITPVLGYGPIHVRFWMFWASHVTITATAVYFLTAEGYRPTWRDFGIITLVMLAYLAVVLPLDLAFGFNYGFVGKDTNLGTATVLDFLGPWPWRLVSMFIVIEVVFAALTVAWYWPVRRGQGATRNTVSASCDTPTASKPHPS
jgi:hypothetical integral membrane protein (TIGR02206 family)